MSPCIRFSAHAGALVLAAVSTAAQNSNDANLNNGGEFYFTYSDPSVAGGDLWWRANSGAGFMNDVDNALGSVMEVDGYLETLLDEDWSTSADFLDRTHGPAVFNPAAGGLQPAFFTAGFTTEVLVSLGSSGFGSPCTLYPSLCVPPGSTCAAPGTAWGWVVDLAFGATPGSGVVMPADGTAASDMATTYFFKGGLSTTGGACGGGTYETNDVHSVDETQADVSGLGVNPSGGFQLGTSGPIQEPVASMGESHETYRGNIINVVANSGGGVEVGDNGGGAMNGRNLRVGTGLASLGVELRDLAGAAGPNVGIVGASTVQLANPGIPALGGWLGVLPNGVFQATSSIWQGSVAATVPFFTTEGIMNGAQLPLPATLASVTLYTQGATFHLTTFSANTTNVVRTRLLP